MPLIPEDHYNQGEFKSPDKSQKKGWWIDKKQQCIAIIFIHKSNRLLRVKGRACKIKVRWEEGWAFSPTQKCEQYPVDESHFSHQKQAVPWHQNGFWFPEELHLGYTKHFFISLSSSQLLLLLKTCKVLRDFWLNSAKVFTALWKEDVETTEKFFLKKSEI